jgi:lysophospholipase L1-like esterase
MCRLAEQGGGTMYRHRARMTSVLVMTIALLAVPAAALADAAPVYYVALGDSLATGSQPAPSGAVPGLNAANGTNRGYVDDLFAYERTKIPKLQLRNFGCGGEDTDSLINGGRAFDIPCGYVLGSQLADAVAFLEAHPGEIAFITIDIGANDFGGCFGILDFSQQCLEEKLPDVQANLGTILGSLRAAAGPDVPIVGMNYYDPFAGLWALGDPGTAIASVEFVTDLNDELEAVYQDAGSPWADVETAFAVTDFANMAYLPGAGSVPLSAYNACTLTWFCSVFDIHANDAGYAAIAGAFVTELP